jgi:hypothetical protein
MGLTIFIKLAHKIMNCLGFRFLGLDYPVDWNRCVFFFSQF